MGLFGPEWDTIPKPKPEPRPKKPRKRSVCPDWLADLLVCSNCRRPLVGAADYAACRVPGCSKLIQRSVVVVKVKAARDAEEETNPDTPDLARCLRMTWRYLRGRMRRKGEPC